MDCTKYSTQTVCLTRADDTTAIAVAHYELGIDENGKTIMKSSRFTDATGFVVYDMANFVSATPCVSDPAVTSVLNAILEKLCEVPPDTYCGCPWVDCDGENINWACC